MFNDITSLTLATAIDGLAFRQQVTANNIANMETPHFHARKVEFESLLADAINAGNPARTQLRAEGTGAPPGVNGNNVNLEDELITATKTGLQQKLLTGTVTARMGWISTVARG